MSGLYDIAIAAIDSEWREFMESGGFASRARAILDNVSKETPLSSISPRPELIFGFAIDCPLHKINVIIVGQDSYPDREVAEGRAFSVAVGAKIKPSLANIFRALVTHGLMPESDVERTGNLVKWARQGVAMINIGLTTMAGKSGAHMDHWSQFSHDFIAAIGRENPGAIYILLGAEAQKIRRRVPSSCSYLEWSHPSPLNAANQNPESPKHFSKCDVFKVANNMLIGRGVEPIDWNPNDDVDTPLIAQTKQTTLILDEDHPLVRDDGKIYAFTDGAASGNGIHTDDGCIATFAVIILVHRNMFVLRGNVPRCKHRGEVIYPSNNRAELMAIYKAIAFINSEKFICDIDARSPLCIVSDSAYAIGCISVWYEKWCRTPPREVKANIDIISRAYEQRNICETARGAIIWHHVHSHRTAPEDEFAYFLWLGNSRVDEIAQKIKTSC